MVGLWLCGFAFAVGHHVYYTSLNGKLAEDQDMVIRYGTAFAFLTKASIVASAGIAIQQFTVRFPLLGLMPASALRLTLQQ
ncbi:hypothetical protein ColLi_10970 [Colletotrichum liriopes]|uniref:Uncharacterized protein n=1 Tax=Colletotrichum liriopes TaxID=708192 RepID=A0AA37GW66_9PEZI|nr:hypothetical protein ColLi_10970 [Colletotrichum liriopes]